MSFTFDEVVEASTKYFSGDRMAAEIFANKYALRSAVDKWEEATPDDMHKRLAREFARIEKKFKKNALAEEQIYDLFKDFKYIVPQGSPMAAIGNEYNMMSASNCLVIASPKDDLYNIMKSGVEMAQLFKRRCGVGVDIGNLRPYDAPVHNAALVSSGAYSFADYYSYITRMIGQRSRVGALMVTMDIMHPDSPAFATMKHNKTKVTGANVSLKIGDEFMRAVEKGEKITLRWPLEGKPKITRVIDARALFDTIVDSAHKTAEPGMLMWDNYTKNLPAHCYEKFKTISTNPCSEIGLSAYDSCRLISINLVNYVENAFTADAHFNLDLFRGHVATATRLSDDLVELELELVMKIRNSSTGKSEKRLWHNVYEAARLGRRIGLGTHGFGDTLAKLGVKYDSEKAQKIAREIYGTLRDSAYGTSVDLAKERGAFPEWDWQKEKNCEFFKRMGSDLVRQMSKYGRRNIALLTNAPTGSISILSKTTSGIEPIFRLEYTRRVKLKGNQGLSIDFVDEMGEKFHNYTVFHPEFANYCKSKGIKLAPNKSVKEQKIEVPDFFTTSDKLNYQENVKLIGIIQSYIDHGVSVTVNLPRESTVETVKQVYIDAWKAGMKGVTVYVEGSRSGILVSDHENGAKSNGTPKRPQDIPCDIHMTNCAGKRWLVIVGLNHGQPYEVFAGRAANLPMPREITKAITRKMGRHEYAIVYQEDGEEVFVPIKESFLENNGMLVRLLINQSLRHGVPLEIIDDTISKASDMNDFSRTVVRVLKKYIPEGTLLGLKCQKCGGHNVRLVDGCGQCNDCSFSKCS